MGGRAGSGGSTGRGSWRLGEKGCTLLSGGRASTAEGEVVQGPRMKAWPSGQSCQCLAEMLWTARAGEGDEFRHWQGVRARGGTCVVGTWMPRSGR